MTYPVNRTAKAAFILFSVAIFGCTVPVENKAANKGASATKVLSTASTAKSSPVAEKKKDVSPPAKRRAAARPPARASAAQSRSASIGPSRNALPPSDGGFSDELRLYRQDRRTYEEDRSLYERDRRDYEDALRNQPPRQQGEALWIDGYGKAYASRALNNAPVPDDGARFDPWHGYNSH